MTDDSPTSPDYEVSPEDPLAGVVELSPNKRYIRFDEILPRTTHSNIQSSYKAFDTKNGIEVAWHIINLNSLDELEQSRVIQSVHTTKDIQNKYITEFLSHWFDKSSRSLNIITSDLSTLREFIDTVIITLRWRIVKKWCKQILMGLHAIHSSTPAIVHGNISCAHIFIDSGLGETKLGDLWLAHVLDADNPLNMNVLVPYSVVFTAPEILAKQSFNTKADIYSFGLFVLEMVTREEPYRECAKMTSYQRKHHIIAGHPPLNLQRIKNTLARDFIQLCLQAQESRPSAEVLLQHEFLNNITEVDDEEVMLGPLLEIDIPVIVAVDDHEKDAFISVDETSSQVIAMATMDSIIKADAISTIEKEQQAHIHVDTSSTISSNVGSSKQDKRIMRILENSESVYHDKGIHDGRRSDHEEDSHMKITSRNFIRLDHRQTPSSTTPSATVADPPISQPADNHDHNHHNHIKQAGSTDAPMKASHPQPIISCTITSIHDHKLQLVMTIPSSFAVTSDSDDRENLQVEFDFDINNDVVESVAAEMIDEIHLKVSVDEISAIIRLQVDSALPSINTSSTVHTTSPIEATTMLSAPSLSADNGTLAADVVASHVHEPIVSEFVVESEIKRSMFANELADISIIKPVEASSDMIQLSAHAPSIETVVIDRHKIEPVAIEPLSISESIIVDDTSTTQPSSPEKPASIEPQPPSTERERSSTVPNTMSSEALDVITEPVPSDSLVTSHSSSTSPKAGANYNRSFFNIGDIGDDEEVRDQIDKLDKEARVARRTFQQRIQKHQSIQESCEEELQEIDSQHEQKMADSMKKEDTSKARREEEASKAKAEFEEKAQKIKEERRLVRAQYIKQMQYDQHQHHQNQQHMHYQHIQLPSQQHHAHPQPMHAPPSQQQGSQTQHYYHSLYPPVAPYHQHAPSMPLEQSYPMSSNVPVSSSGMSGGYSLPPVGTQNPAISLVNSSNVSAWHMDGAPSSSSINPTSMGPNIVAGPGSPYNPSASPNTNSSS